MLEHHLDGGPIGAAPDQFSLARPLAHTHTQLDVVGSQIADQSAEGAQLFKCAEEEPHDLLHLFIGIELDFSAGAPDIANWQGKLQVTPLSFTQTPLIHALL
jgi:hypothetical protein